MSPPIRRPSSTRVWWRALRAYSFPASIVPCLVGAAYGWAAGAEVSWVFLPLVLVTAVALHVGTNLVNDAADFGRGVDDSPRHGSGVIPLGWLTPRQVWGGVGVAYLVAILAGAPVLWARGWPLLAIGVAGAIGGYAYTGKPFALKYRALGEVWVFFMMGVLMVVGAAYALCGTFPRGIWLASVPVSFLVATILAANNQRDREDDARQRIRTLAILLGHRGARLVTAGLLVGAFVSLPLLVAAGVLPLGGLFPFVTLPLAWPLLRAIATQQAGASLAAGVVERTAGLHLAFGLTLAIGLVAQGALG
jgi:1,4-dihydroxy-2-naphthoate octaprenyltransferase